MSVHPSALVSLVAASLVSAAWAGGQLRLVGSYDVRTKTGTLLDLSDPEPMMAEQRPGLVLRDVRPVAMGDRPHALVIWTDVAEGRITSPELWTVSEAAHADVPDSAHAQDPDGHPAEEDLSAGPLNLWFRQGKLAWLDARFRLKGHGAEVQLMVERSLAGENRQEPLLKVKEVYQLAATGLVRERFRYDAAKTPEQLLNLLDDQAKHGLNSAAAGTLWQLPADPLVWRERAALVLGRYAQGGDGKAVARKMLEGLASSDSKVAGEAADKLLDLDWDEMDREAAP